MIQLVAGKDVTERAETGENTPSAPAILPSGKSECDKVLDGMETKLVTQMWFDVRHLLVDDELLKKKRAKELENRQKL